jgi:hypothetical protein
MTEWMVERVARALWVAHCDAHTDEGSQVQDHPMYIAQARAALHAMREPTEAMLSMGCIDLGSGGDLDDKNVLQIWQAMIDEALK